jgi:hypothetical protein
MKKPTLKLLLPFILGLSLDAYASTVSFSVNNNLYNDAAPSTGITAVSIGIKVYASSAAATAGTACYATTSGSPVVYGGSGSLTLCSSTSCTCPGIYSVEITPRTNSLGYLVYNGTATSPAVSTTLPSSSSTVISTSNLTITPITFYAPTSYNSPISLSISGTHGISITGGGNTGSDNTITAAATPSATLWTSVSQQTILPSTPVFNAANGAIQTSGVPGATTY